MIFLWQRVEECEVRKDNDEFVSKIEKGIVIYVGIEKKDEESVDILVEKGKKFIKNNFKAENLMLLSQFTLMGEFRGKKPSFHKAGDNKKAEEVFYKLKEVLNAKSGIFRTLLKIKVKGDNLKPTVTILT